VPYREQSDVTITIDAPERGRVIIDWQANPPLLTSDREDQKSD
jgi:hypothetical protein